MTSKLYVQMLGDLQTNEEMSPDCERVAIDFLRRKIITMDEYHSIDEQAGQAKKRKKLYSDILVNKDADTVMNGLLTCAEEHGWVPVRDYIRKLKSTNEQ